MQSKVTGLGAESQMLSSPTMTEIYFDFRSKHPADVSARAYEEAVFCWMWWHHSGHLPFDFNHLVQARSAARLQKIVCVCAVIIKI